MKKKLLSILLILSVLSSAFLFTACESKDYSKHTFTYFGEDFSWDWTKEDAAEYILQNEDETWREVKINDFDVTNGNFTFEFNSDGQLMRIRCDAYGGARFVTHYTNMFGPYDEYESDLSINYNAYTWYGTMGGENTKVLLYTTSSDVYLHFMHEDRY